MFWPCSHPRKSGAVPAPLVLLLAAGCASAGYKKPATACLDDYATAATTETARETRERALRHSAYRLIPFQRSQMHCWDPRHLSWFVLGNDADGIFGEGMAAEHPYSTNINCWTWFRWDVVRNGGHNMLFYPPLGSACFSKHWNWSLFKADGAGVKALGRDRTGVFGEGRCAFKINFNDLKPFFSLKLGNFETYLGWRERGNLGASFRFHRRKKPEGVRIPEPVLARDPAPVSGSIRLERGEGDSLVARARSQAMVMAESR